MSLALVIQYGDGFEQGQEDMEMHWFDLNEIASSFLECETKEAREKQEAFWNGYVDGGMAYLDGIRL